MEMTCDDIDDCGDNASCDEGNSGDGFMCLCDDGYTGTAYNEEATCVENTCNAFTFEEGMIVSTSTSYCTEGTWCSSAKRENISFSRSLTQRTHSVSLTQPMTLSALSPYCIPHSQQYHSNVTEILNSRFALEHRYSAVINIRHIV